MADFVKLAATAQRLIAANGRPVTIVKFGSTSADDSKPWRGRREYHEAEVAGRGVFVPESVVNNPDGVKRENEFLLFAANDDGGHELETFDAIEDGGRTWKIVQATLLEPGSTRLLYEFEVAR